MQDPEIVTVGRISVDLYGEELGAGWDTVARFVKAVGGTATNVAVAAARLGHRAAVVTQVGQDAPGRYLRKALDDHGVDTRFVGTHDRLPTPLAFAVTERPDEPELTFYRQPAAPDLQLTTDDLPTELVRRVPALWLTGSGFSSEPSREAHHAWLRSRERRDHTILDLDHRPGFWSSEGEAREQMQAALRQVSVAVGNREECRVATGVGEPDAAADRLLEAGVRLAVVKQGGDGVLVASADERVTVGQIPVEVVCGLGAGDAFGGALLHGLLQGWQPDHLVSYANAAGAIVASRLLCSDAMPTQDEVDALLTADRERGVV